MPYSYAKRACDGFKQLAARGISVLVSSGDAGVGNDGDCVSNIDNTTVEFIPNFPTSVSVGSSSNLQSLLIQSFSALG